jgi:uncharacterized protein GlcG (DUF336 family)
MLRLRLWWWIAPATLLVATRSEHAIRYAVEPARGKPSFDNQATPSSEFLAIANRIDEITGGALVFAKAGGPVSVGGRVIGGVGLSGSTAEIDEQVAVAAAATLDPKGHARTA